VNKTFVLEALNKKDYLEDKSVNGKGKIKIYSPYPRSEFTYEGVSKIFRTGASIYTAVVVARSTGRW
jgi:hypothetical protein